MRSMVLGLFILSTAGAVLHSKPQWVWMQYPETFCSDPWYSVHDTLTRQGRLHLIGQYLHQQGVAFRRSRITETEPGIARCAGCGCTTGLIVHLEIAASDTARAASLGFRLR